MRKSGPNFPPTSTIGDTSVFDPDPDPDPDPSFGLDFDSEPNVDPDRFKESFEEESERE